MRLVTAILLLGLCAAPAVAQDVGGRESGAFTEVDISAYDIINGDVDPVPSVSVVKYVNHVGIGLLVNTNEEGGGLITTRLTSGPLGWGRLHGAIHLIGATIFEPKRLLDNGMGGVDFRLRLSDKGFFKDVEFSSKLLWEMEDDDKPEFTAAFGVAVETDIF